METIFTLSELPKSIFLAGPTPREDDVVSWRKEALAILEEIGFSGSVLVPEQSDWKSHEHYDDQINWEWEAINLATVVVFWVPRDLDVFPAFTTNVEFGFLAASGKCVLGYPEDAPKMAYLDALGTRFGMEVYGSLRETLEAAVEKATAPFGGAVVSGK